VPHRYCARVVDWQMMIIAKVIRELRAFKPISIVESKGASMIEPRKLKRK
jgi:hypothetical protein